MTMIKTRNSEGTIKRLGVLMSASSILLATSLSGCGAPPTLTPEDKAWKRQNTFRSKNLFEKEDHNHSYANYQDVKPTPSKPVITASGLEIQDIEQGWGNTPEPNRMVLVHYTGYLSDGTKFDSSRDKGIPFSFVIGTGRVIPGFEEGLKGMKVGGKRKITVPPSLGYGAQGHGKSVPPNATLVYEVQLLSADR